jgi:hypothetical protein
MSASSFLVIWSTVLLADTTATTSASEAYRYDGLDQTSVRARLCVRARGGTHLGKRNSRRL